MKILEVKTLIFPEISVIRYQRSKDERGYFTETYRTSDFEENPQTPFLKGVQFTQVNESFSHKNVVRGLHFQWNPYMGKLIRTLKGTLIDVALDIRIGSPNFGKIVGYELSTDEARSDQEWTWIPVGFAHGFFATSDVLMEYLCTGQWAPDTERGISPLSSDIDWTLFDARLKTKIDEILKNPILSDKDRNGLTVAQWKESPDSQNFVYGKV